MNNINVDQQGGLRLDTGILQFGLDAPKIAQMLGYLAHNYAIIQGCEESNNIVSDGVVFINGELLPFKQSLKQNTVVIVETKQKRFFKDGSQKDVLIERHAEFGVSTQSHNWTAFYRIKSLKQLEQEIATKIDADAFNTLLARVNKLEVLTRPLSVGGSMMFWNRPAFLIPEGWQEVEDWRGRMSVGWDPNDADFNVIGKISGWKQYNISIPSTGWTAVSQHAGGKPTGQLVVTNGQNEQGESIESMSTTSPRNIEINTLSPYRVVMYIEPIIE